MTNSMNAINESKIAEFGHTVSGVPAQTPRVEYSCANGHLVEILGRGGTSYPPQRGTLPDGIAFVKYVGAPAAMASIRLYRS
jgi:hypothetical protein